MSVETAPSVHRLSGRSVERRDGGLPTRRSVRGTAGIVALVGAAGVTIVSGTTPVSILLAGIAVVLLAGHPTLGPLGAAAVVILTLPFDRAANGYLPRIAGIPVRPQDLAVLIGLGLCLPSVRFRRPRAGVGAWLLVAFVAIGIVALVGGFVGGNVSRDILRDARWWFLYGSGLVLLFLPPSARAQVVRGVLLGALGFAVVVVITSVLPAVPGGLRARAEEFDFGLLRLQYGNSVFLLFLLARGTSDWIRGHTAAIAPLALASLAVMLSLTRTLMIVSAAVVVLVVLASLAAGHVRGGAVRRRLSLARIGAAVAVVPLSLVMALAINIGTGRPAPVTNEPSSSPAVASQEPSSPALTPKPAKPAGEDPFGRITFENDESGWGVISGGRLKAYGRALEVIGANPLGGSGMGATVVADYAFGGETFATPGRLPNVDNAYLTAGMKGGLPAMAILGLLLAWPALRGLRYLRGRIARIWWLPAWIGILVLTMTQSFATTGYGPFLLGMLVVIFGRGYASRSVRLARPHE